MHTSARMPPRARFGFCRLDAPVTVFLYLQRFNQLVAIKVMDEYCSSSHRVCPALFLISSHRDGYMADEMSPDSFSNIIERAIFWCLS